MRKDRKKMIFEKAKQKMISLKKDFNLNTFRQNLIQCPRICYKKLSFKFFYFENFLYLLQETFDIIKELQLHFLTILKDTKNHN